MRHLHFRAALAAITVAFLPSCTTGGGPMDRPDSGGISPVIDGGFFCLAAESEACIQDTHYSCTSDGEFLRPTRDECGERGLVCEPGLWCVNCHPGRPSCNAEGDAVICADDGSGTTLLDDCDTENGEVCDLGRCVNLCDQALIERSYLGCEFFATDLDNAAIGAGRDASSQQYAIVVSNPGNYPTDVVIELDVGEFGGTTTPVVVSTQRVLPGDLEVFALPRRELDGSSSFAPCANDAECSSASQQCFCRGGARPGAGAEDCRCRSSSTGGGLNDGTHSALTAHAYRVRSGLPIVAYQFNPLDNVGVFSNDASLLLPVSAIGTRYTVIGWPQTIADSTSPSEDFNPTTQRCTPETAASACLSGICEGNVCRCNADAECGSRFSCAAPLAGTSGTGRMCRVTDEDLRAFLTIVGTEAATHLTVTLGPLVRNVVGVGGQPNGVAGDVWEFDLGEFDVVNLETQGFNADFTGTQIEATAPVSVFTGSEASDAPRFDDLANRRCCADHLEEQLFANDTLGRRFFIGRNPTRTHALNMAFLDPTVDSVGEFNEPEYVRVVAVEEGLTRVTTTMPFPDDYYEIAQGESVIITATQDLELNADQAVAVLQVIASQEAVGIPSDYPGGDPAILAVPPFDQWRTEYVFLTPDLYAFDFVTIVAPRETRVLLDERPIEDFECEYGAADGVPRIPGDPAPEYVVYRCQLSFPDVIGLPNVRVEDGLQNDGYHTVRATEEVSLVVSGFDAFVSYAYVGGANLSVVN